MRVDKEQYRFDKCPHASGEFRDIHWVYGLARHYEHQDLCISKRPNWVQEAILYIRQEETNIQRERMIKV